METDRNGKEAFGQEIQAQLNLAIQFANEGGWEMFENSSNLLGLLKNNTPELYGDIRKRAFNRAIGNLDWDRRIDPDRWSHISQNMTRLYCKLNEIEIKDEQIPEHPAFPPRPEDLQYQNEVIKGGLLIFLNYRYMPWLRLYTDEELESLYENCANSTGPKKRGGIGYNSKNINTDLLLAEIKTVKNIFDIQQKID